jgi:ribonuclease HII
VPLPSAAAAAAEISFVRRLLRSGAELPDRCIHVVGADEAGAGCLAGPLVAAACRLPHTLDLPGLCDSKAANDITRRRLYNELMTAASPKIAVEDRVLFTVAFRSVRQLNTTGNLLQSRMAALAEGATGVELALRPLTDHPPHRVAVIVDGGEVPPHLAADLCAAVAAVPKADAMYRSVSAASIIAKVQRDDAMLELHRRYGAYGFDRHMGYGTAKHRAAVAELGPTVHHRALRSVHEGGGDVAAVRRMPGLDPSVLRKLRRLGVKGPMTKRVVAAKAGNMPNNRGATPRSKPMKHAAPTGTERHAKKKSNEKDLPKKH